MIPHLIALSLMIAMVGISFALLRAQLSVFAKNADEDRKSLKRIWERVQEAITHRDNQKKEAENRTENEFFDWKLKEHSDKQFQAIQRRLDLHMSDIAKCGEQIDRHYKEHNAHFLFLTTQMAEKEKAKNSKAVGNKRRLSEATRKKISERMKALNIARKGIPRNEWRKEFGKKRAEISQPDERNPNK